MAFGTVETWSYLVMGLLVCISAMFLFWDATSKNGYHIPGLLPLLMVNVFVLFQLIPLPAGVVKHLSPGAYSIYQGAAGLTGNLDWICLSVYPRGTLMELLRFSIYTLFYCTAIQLFADRRLLKKTILIISWFASLLSLIAIIEFVTESLNYPLAHDNIFWLRELRQGGTPMGPYVNRNHYAGFMEMIFPLVLAMFLAYRPQITRLSLKRKITDFLNHRQISRHFLYGTATILIATSILLSLSRGGIISLAMSMIIFAGFLFFKARQKKTGYLMTSVVILVLFWTGTSGWDAIFKRFEIFATRPA